MSHLNVFDDKVPFIVRDNLWNYCINSTYRLGWEDTDVPEKYDLNIHSNWSTEELESTEILPHFKKCIDETDWFTNNILDKIIVNLVKSDDVHHIHTHRFNQVALYYINLNWQDGWYGETLFFDKFNTNNIVFASSFVPGRIVLFDGDIPHSIRPQSRIATKFRMTLSLFYISKR